ncbi:hypothetical protein MBRA_04225 [Methylobacterium brachiatum]|nr:hypothetical protein MBRA_04225 [Methylobacterium brachiatum]
MGINGRARPAGQDDLDRFPVRLRLDADREVPRGARQGEAAAPPDQLERAPPPQRAQERGLERGEATFGRVVGVVGQPQHRPGAGALDHVRDAPVPLRDVQRAGAEPLQDRAGLVARARRPDDVGVNVRGRPDPAEHIEGDLVDPAPAAPPGAHPQVASVDKAIDRLDPASEDGGGLVAAETGERPQGRARGPHDVPAVPAGVGDQEIADGRPRPSPRGRVPLQDRLDRPRRVGLAGSPEVGQPQVAVRHLGRVLDLVQEARGERGHVLRPEPVAARSGADANEAGDDAGGDQGVERVARQPERVGRRIPVEEGGQRPPDQCGLLRAEGPVAHARDAELPLMDAERLGQATQPFLRQAELTRQGRDRQPPRLAGVPGIAGRGREVAPLDRHPPHATGEDPDVRALLRFQGRADPAEARALAAPVLEGRPGGRDLVEQGDEPVLPPPQHVVPGPVHGGQVETLRHADDRARPQGPAQGEPADELHGVEHVAQGGEAVEQRDRRRPENAEPGEDVAFQGRPRDRAARYAVPRQRRAGRGVRERRRPPWDGVARGVAVDDVDLVIGAARERRQVPPDPVMRALGEAGRTETAQADLPVPPPDFLAHDRD